MQRAWASRKKNPLISCGGLAVAVPIARLFHVSIDCHLGREQRERRQHARAFKKAGDRDLKATMQPRRQEVAAVSLLQATARGDDATSPAQLDAAPSVLFIHVYIYKGMRILCYIKYSHE